ncbi:MAG: DUF1549 domain-containing protein [Gemmataceae bacterium]
MKIDMRLVLTSSAALLVALAFVLADDKVEQPAPAAKVEEKLPANAKVVKLEIHPASIDLKHPYDYRQVIVTGTLAGGEKIDVTRMVEATIAAPDTKGRFVKLVKVSDRGMVRPLLDGAGQLSFQLTGQTVSIPVKVSGQKEPYQVSFVRDVMPAMSKLGCNAGTCHGAQSGKNGFKLSLRGYDPEFDHLALTDDLSGRRFNRSAPDRSLMLLKPSGAVPHVGGAFMQPGEPHYEMLRTWIGAGVKFDANSPRVSKIEILPKTSTIPLPGMKQQMAVYATYTDNSVRDVTAEAFVESSNTEVAKVDSQGLVTALRRGESAMMARFEGAYDVATLIVMGDRSGFVWKEQEQFNYIDQLVDEKLKQVKVQSSGLCTDAEFIRRVYLDLTGLPPSPEVVKAFLADTRPTRVKRDEVIDKLVGSPEFIELWTNKWADLLQVNRKFLGDEGAKGFRAWIRDQVAKNRPYDEFAREILTASGSNIENPPASYYKILRQPDDIMENTTQLFLAVRFNCNKCHDHPFERWTQGQYYHLAAYFAQIGLQEDPKYKGKKIGGSAVEGAKPLVEIVADKKAGDIKHLRTGEVAQPQFPYEIGGMPPPAGTRRDQLARWMTSPENPYFARSYVNRLWSYLLGVGLIEPIDDIRAGNPPTNPKLLDRLTADFIDHKFDVQHMFKTICKSRVYQQSHLFDKWNADDQINYSHALARRLPAEVLYDSIHRATGSLSRLPGLPPGARAAQLVDTNVPIPGGFLDLFGSPARESACECERSDGLMLGPVLNLVNGPVINDALKDPNNRINKLVAEEKDDAKVVEELFVSILCRKPSKEELAAGIQAMRGNDDEFTRLQGEHKKHADALAGYEKNIPARVAAWEKEVGMVVPWTPIEVVEAKSSGGAELVKQDDGSVLAKGKNPSPETYTITLKTDVKNITGIRLEVLPDDSLPAKGPGRAPNGNFVLNELKLTGKPIGQDSPQKPQPLQNPQADFSQGGFEIAKAIDNNPGTGWAVSPEFGKKHQAVFELKRALQTQNGAELVLTLEQKYAGKDHSIGKFRVSVTSMKPVRINQLPPAITAILKVPADKRTPQQQQQLTAHFTAGDNELARLRQAVADHPQPMSPRAIGAQDLAWAMLNSPAFLFNH